MFDKLMRLIKIFLYKIDLFSSAQLLRVKTQTGYSTLTGGFISLTIIVIFGTLLIQDSIKVLTKSDINSINSIYYEEDPKYVSFNLNDTNPFIFAVGIQNINLTTGSRYFDVNLTTITSSFGKKGLQIFHQLQPCRQQQWSYLSKNGANSFKNLGLDGFLCPPRDIAVQLQGKYTSQTFKYMRLRVAKCRNTSDPRPCADPLTISQTGTFTLSFYFMNTYINSADLQPVDYYLEDRNFFGFTMNSSSNTNLYMTEQTIITDQSLFPWTQKQNSHILYISQLAEYKPNQVSSSSTYISVFLRKAPYFKVSERSYPKLIDLFSNIGGLFGFVVTFFMFLNEYTQVSYEIQMGQELFYYDSTQPLQSKTFNFFYFLILCVYDLFRKIDVEIPWKKMQRYYQCKQQIKQQLDLSLFMNKITFLEKCMNVLFEQHQFRAIYLQQKPDVKQAQILRKNHGLNKIIHHQTKYFNKKTQYQVKKQKTKFIQNIMDVPKTDSLILDKIDRLQQHQIQSKAVSIESATSNKIPYDLLELVVKYIEKYPVQQKKETSQNQSNRQVRTQDIQLQEVVERNGESLKFINVALNDIRLIQQQSKKGNTISSRIYHQLNNDITKEQFIVLKLLDTIVAKKESGHVHQQQEKGEYKFNFVEKILNLRNGNHEEERQDKRGLQIVLQSNNRIVTNNNL